MPLNTKEIHSIFSADSRLTGFVGYLQSSTYQRFHLKGLAGSATAVVAASLFRLFPGLFVFVLNDKEEAVYFLNDLENLLGESEQSFHKKQVLFFPSSNRRPYELEHIDNTNVLMRTEVLKRISSRNDRTIIVTYPEALAEKVVSKSYLKKNTLKIKSGDLLSLDFVFDILMEYGFHQVDFVVEPGQYAVRGGIIDVFSYSNDLPYRLEFIDEKIESIRSFNPESQLSLDKLSHITLIPNVQDSHLLETRESFLKFLPQQSVLWITDLSLCSDRIDYELTKARKAYDDLKAEVQHLSPSELYLSGHDFRTDVLRFATVETGSHAWLNTEHTLLFNAEPQPVFNKNFDMLIDVLLQHQQKDYTTYITTASGKQTERLYAIFDDLKLNRGLEENSELFTPLLLPLKEGFIEHSLKIACFTDHQIFERYHRFRLKDNFRSKEAITLKELYDLKPGDFVTHIDHGVGRFDGLEKLDTNGKKQEAVRIIYKNGDILYVSIHSLHRIAKYSGKEGSVPNLDKLGSGAWANLKNKTKQKVKDIARDLIELYAKRKSSRGFAFAPDTYLQHELEASFIYEDTPDQIKATSDIKADMEKEMPMDRLLCGDVGFGKTEIAIRAAFKAVSDSKQVAVLVPTTILALQHFKTFSERLKEFPCKVDYINRFKSTARQNQCLKELHDGKLDILIGTHRLLGKDIEFKDLGLLIVDEEQKFGVAAKEKLKKLRVNIDTLTLTATPIPRTLQFSLMGARDLSIINTPPPNRYPVQTELHVFNEEIIRDAIYYEMNRGGQVFFVHNRVNNIAKIAGLIQRLVPLARVAIGHGQMEGRELEAVMLDFIEGEYDILVATTIIEAGLDIPNVNTIIINQAHHFGLSDLHQLRGRVGRTNKKAFCYLLAPPASVLTDEARKRLRAIEEFSNLGSGFNIAMRDLDIRGAGNLLGSEQSGFIADIGFEMYQKIIDEAIQELKEAEFKDLFPENATEDFVKDCQIETDMEILIPDDYVNVVSERLSLYKELDEVKDEDSLLRFQDKLIDRFGSIPVPVQELLNTVRVRWVARELGFEKIVLKQNRMIAYFLQNMESGYFQSAAFDAILTYIKLNPARFTMKELNNKPVLNVANISKVVHSLDLLRSIQAVLKPAEPAKSSEE